MSLSSDPDHQVERINWQYLLDRRGILVEDLYGKLSQATDANWFQGFWDAGTDCSGVLHDWEP
jgi:hypothetical protein